MSALKINLTKSLKLYKIKKKKHLTLIGEPSRLKERKGPIESTHHLPSLVHHRGSGRRRARQNRRSSNHHERRLLISDPNFVKTHLHRAEFKPPSKPSADSSACQSHGAHSSPTPILSKPTSTAPKLVPEEAFADLGNNESSLIISTNDEFRWFSDMETTSSTVLESPIFAERTCLKISMKRPGREG